MLMCSGILLPENVACKRNWRKPLVARNSLICPCEASSFRHRSQQASRWRQNLMLCRSLPEQDTPKQPSGRDIEVTLRRPLGMVLAEDTDRKVVFVEEVVQGGNAESSGRIAVGDIVSKVSATVLKAGKDGQYEKEGYGQRPYDNWDKIMFDCRGQDFKTVMSAIDSNNPRWGINHVTLVLRREQ